MIRSVLSSLFGTSTTQRSPKRNSRLSICQLEAREVPATGPNLLLNPSVETASGSRPANWQTGKWGTNNATFTYLNPGIEGSRAVRVDMSTRSSGDAKWYADDVPVTGGATYEFSNQSVSTTSTVLTLRFLLSNGSYLYQGNKVVPASAAPQTNNYVFTAPANAVSVTVFHIIQSAGSLTTDNFSLALQTNTSDTTAPSVSVTGPTNNATVSGTVNFTANATDNVGVAGVQFRVNGNVVGTEDTTSPYSTSFNTTTLVNGTYTLTATARDAANNVTTSAPITLVINNPVVDLIAPTVGVASPTSNQTVAGNTTLTASATDNVGVASVRFNVNGNAIGTAINTAPYSFVLDTTTLTNGSHSITAIATDAAGNSTTSAAVTINVSNLIQDTMAPTVSITAPTSNASVSGTAPITATATDNIGVSWVRFYVDGNAVGTNITQAPYTYALNTNGLTNGSHTLTAIAVDAVGNTTTSAPVSITVNNAPTNNLILNPSLETAGTGSDPANWVRGGWGVNSSTYTYPIAGTDGVKAARIDTTSFTSGDAKWFFSDVPVTAGQTYTFSNSYRSNTATELVLRYLNTNATYQYISLANLNASTNWLNTTHTFVAPAGVSSVTIFHNIRSVGFLEVDNYALSTNTVVPPPSNGALVSFTFDDGWNSQYYNAMPILTTGNIQATFYVMSEAPNQAQQYELVRNPSLESQGNGNNPANWSQRATGSNTALFSYPVTGKVGDRAAKVEVTNYNTGDAAWTHQNVNVIPGRQYTISNQYSSTASTTLAVQYTNSNNTTTLVDLATLGSTGSAWKTVTRTVSIPSGVTSMTVVQLLRGVGSVTVDDFSLRLVPNALQDFTYFGTPQVRALEALGHEIGAHTKTHASLTSIPYADAVEEVNGSRIGILNMGVSSVDTLAYPYGDFNATTKQIVANAGLIGARTVFDGYNTSSTDRYELTTFAVERDTTIQEIRAAIDGAIATGTWLTLMFHRIDYDPNDIYGCTPETLQQTVDYVNSRPIEDLTVRDALYRMGLA